MCDQGCMEEWRDLGIPSLPESLESELGGLSLSEAVSGVKSWTSRMWTSTLYYSVSFFA
jgi:hypothetical protein